ncbi:hypothetical protein [Microbulbifer taiwanensis]|uniref:phosphorylase family protein n=1 Tax=Microbulbifer taiwanensis TaxID=986746 RepID=UPI003613EC71
MQGVPVAFLARHGRGHRLIPSEVPYRANIHALRQLGVRYILSLSAVGSLREEVRPLDMLIPDQFIDMTRRRESSFFGDGAVAHVSMADPVCARVADCLARGFGIAQGKPPRGTSRLHCTAAAAMCVSRDRSFPPAPSPTGSALWAPL